MGALESYMFEKYLIEYCSPTLASLKTASLFTYSFDCDEELQIHIDTWNMQLCKTGVRLFVLRKRQNTALIYVYRKAKLEEDLQNPSVISFLSKYGYTDNNPDSVLKRLKSRLSESDDFPHEIGTFLGYPLGDVIGFIKNEGQNCKFVGFWKVYCNECEAVKLFEKFKKCKDVYTRLWSQGRSVLQLTVAV